MPSAREGPTQPPDPTTSGSGGVHPISTELLLGKDEAPRQALTDIANRELRWIVPPGATAVVTIRDRQVTVSLDAGKEAA